jgi:FkbM family methyltransferase
MSSIPILDTKCLFVSLLKRLDCDLVLDIGSRDGKQAILFRDTLPEADVVAYEANPYNYRRILSGKTFLSKNINLHQSAVSNENGTATFHVSKADYSAPETITNNLGTSSLLSAKEWETAERIEVLTERLDTLLSKPEMAKNKRTALWIDVEGAEYLVLEGIGEMAEKVVLVHVETALEPLREGQKTLDEIKLLLGNYGLDPIGSNISSNQNWGDVVFCRRNLIKSRFKDVRVALQIAKLQYFFGGNNFAMKFKRFPWLFKIVRWLFIRLS